MAISYVSTGTTYSSNSFGTSYTLNKPSSISSGDLMIAVAAFDTYSAQASSVTINHPSGWTTSRTVVASQYCLIRVMYRVAGSSEPSSWNGSTTIQCSHRVAFVSAYRGATGIATSNSGTAGGGTSVSTGSVTNPSASNWRFTVGAYVSSSISSAITSNENTLRRNAKIAEGALVGGIEASLWDSGGTIGTGSTSRSVGRGAAWESAGAYIGIIAANSEAIPGELDVDIDLLPAFAAEAELSVEGSLDADMLLPEMEAAGIASPPEGSMEITVPISVEMEGAHDSAGSLDVVIPIEVGVAAETRSFGVRVVIPERESRVVTPRLGASD
jgi:hypothetical protein